MLMGEKAKVAVLISGRGTNMAALIYAARAENCPYEIVLVSSDRSDAPGLALAEAEGIEVVRLPSPARETKAQFFSDLDRVLSEASADYVVLAGFMRILPDAFVAGWTGRMINIHPSLLPKYRGLGTYQAALDARDAVAGCTVHLVTAELDSGPILGQCEVAVIPDDTAETLAERVRIAEHQLLPRVLADYVSRERDPDWIVAKVAELALALPETRFKTRHGAPAWRVGSESSGRHFAVMWLNHHSEGGIALLVKCSGQDELAALVEADPDHYFRPPYYRPSDWIGLRLDRGGVDWDHVAEWLAKSWRVIAPAKLGNLMRAADEF